VRSVAEQVVGNAPEQAAAEYVGQRLDPA